MYNRFWLSCLEPFDFIAPLNILIIWLCNHLTRNVSDEGCIRNACCASQCNRFTKSVCGKCYTKNAICALNYIYTFLLVLTLHIILKY